MKTSMRANARAMMKEGASPSAAMMAAHGMCAMAQGGVGPVGGAHEPPADESPKNGIAPNAAWHGAMSVGGAAGKLAGKAKKLLGKGR